MFEAVEFTEVRDREEPDQRVIGTFPNEIGAVEALGGTVRGQGGFGSTG